MRFGTFNPADNSSTKPWFISSIVITLLLIFLLSGNLAFSIDFIDSFRREELRAERSSWKLLLYTEKMQMTARVSALGGNLKWKDNYTEAQEKFEAVLGEITDLQYSSKIREKSEELRTYYRKTRNIEQRVFELISTGEKERAVELLSGWEYTKSRLQFEKETREIVHIIQERIEEKTSLYRSRSFTFLSVVVACFIGLLGLWAVTIRRWSRHVRDKQITEIRVRQSEEKYRKLINTSPEAIAFVDEGGRILTANPVMAQRLSVERSRLEGAHLNEVMPSEQAKRHMERGSRAIDEAGVESYQEESDEKVYENTYVPVFTRGARNTFQIISRDITEQKRLEEKLKNLSLYDSLTKLYARSFFEEEMSRLEDGRHTPVGMIVCDVDGLKLINDEIGHSQGDDLLIAAAQVLRKSFRGSDIVARIGGDEFAVLLPKSGEEVVSSACDRIRENCARHNEREVDFVLSISIGYTIAETPPVNTNELFKEADNRMYEDKRQHREEVREKIMKIISS